ncbi:MAG: anaerobic ribonucleoside triphosphate reductase [Bacilli bacterium]|nr:anaerobic ribonucleoside triphosphate reductase [bacterium]MDY2697667.1 anaerobic ribonucleoside triphosphate reductase [Bacilli bacterium]MDY5993029.1 anaerobic ribonucleoside triphosphate reductase [Bacilli bacterium]MEE0014461.1 anaerobic ribonucleoside triphosphate reductase [Bacilli bacterium]
MVEVSDKLEQLMVIKRNGKKVPFDETKIALAIKKGFDSVSVDNGEDEKLRKYDSKDIQKVYQAVLKKIEKEAKKTDKFQIEQIQDFIEEELSSKGYEDVYKSFSEYRERRAQSRQSFFDDKKTHKFLKSLENLGLKSANEEDAKRENANIDGNSPMGTMLQYGSTVSREFAKAYLMKPEYAKMHDEGEIHIHDMDFLAMGTTTCCQIDLSRLFKNGFDTGHGYVRPPQDISTYSSLAAIVIQANQNDQHGGQSIPALDYYLAPGVLKTFKKQFKQTIYDFLDLEGFIGVINIDRIIREIDKIESIDVNLEEFSDYQKGSNRVKEIFKLASEKALQKTDRATQQAMEAFVHNLNTMHSRAGAQVPFSSVNFGTDISPEGRMVTKNLLLATDRGLGNGETPIFPVSIFKVKEGVNYNKEDPNYDLFRLACKVSAKRLFPNFAFIDAPFNLQYYKPGDVNTEIAYMGCRTRVLADVTSPDNQIVTGRGNLSFTTINLPRLGIKYGIALKERDKADMKGFYEELGEIMDKVRDQLLERFEVQCSKHSYNFPFLLGQGVWTNGEKLKPTDRLRKVWKHGSLSTGFIGLAECLKALTGEHHGESKASQKLGLEIIKFMRKRCDENSQKYNLNFTCLATPAEGLSGRFTSIDRAIYGKIKGVTDREYYTNSFHVPVYYNISISDKLKTEAPYHELTNGGHISYIELDGDVASNVDAFEKVIRIMKESGIGYGAVNHPVDRDPVCGYVGVINDVCPGCGRHEFEGIPVEKITAPECCGR